MRWKFRVSVLARDLCHISLCGVTNMTMQTLSHKQQSADLGKVLVVVYNTRWSD